MVLSFRSHSKLSGVLGVHVCMETVCLLFLFGELKMLVVSLP